MPLSIQPKILRAIQNKTIRRIGGKETIKIDVRYIAATNKDLTDLVKTQTFREDLLYRLNAATLIIPPLRERKEDIPVIINYVLEDYSRNNSNKAKYITNEVMQYLLEYHWPGNVRELINTIYYMVTISLSEKIGPDELPSRMKDCQQKIMRVGFKYTNEKAQILEMLEKTNYNKKKTSELLSISRKTLYNKLKKYGINAYGKK